MCARGQKLFHVPYRNCTEGLESNSVRIRYGICSLSESWPLVIILQTPSFRPRSESSTPSGRRTARRPSPALRGPRPARGRPATPDPSSSSRARRAADPARGDSVAATTTKTRWVAEGGRKEGMELVTFCDQYKIRNIEASREVALISTLHSTMKFTYWREILI